jgi:hypothetical protein
MTPEHAYEKYVALKMHFSSSDYDYFKYSGKIKANKESYENRNDRAIFNKVCKKYKDVEYTHILVSNFLYDSELWIGDIISDSGIKRYEEWKKRSQSITYTFNQEINFIEDYLIENDLIFNDLFKKEEPYPKIVKFCIQKQISIDTFCIMNKILNFVPKIDRIITERILWEKYKIISIKYAPFICTTENIKKYKHIMLDKFHKKLDNQI